MHGRMRELRERERESCATVRRVDTRVGQCGGAALLSHATQRCVELRGHDSAIPRCMARSASWPSIKLAGLICNWISMAPSNVAIVIRSRYLAAPKAHRKFWPSPPPPSTKSVILGGGSDPPSSKSVMLGGGSGVFPFRAPPPGAMCAPPSLRSPFRFR